MLFCTLEGESDAHVCQTDSGYYATLRRDGTYREHWYETLEKLENGLRFWQGRGVRVPQSCFDEIAKAKV